MHRWIIGACVFYVGSVAVYFGFITTDINVSELKPYFNKTTTITVQIDSYPDSSESGTKFIASTIELPGNTILKSKVLVRIPSGLYIERAQIDYGDVLEITGTIKQPESFIGDTGRTFNYPAYLAVDGVYGIIEPTHVTWLTNEGNGVIRLLYKMRTWFVNRLGNYFEGNEHGLLAGMLIGEKSRLSKDLAKDFQIVGLSHIVVLSGYNITLVVSAIMYVCQWCGCGYRSKRGVAAAIVPLFVIMTGAGASSVRAGVMSVMQLVLQIDTRLVRAHILILYTITLMVASSPRSLVHSPSFHLSFLAFIGLIYVVPIIKSVKWVADILQRVQSSVAGSTVSNLIIETVSVQLFVLPYIIYMSGTFSLISLGVNILVVPLVSLIMFGGMVVVIVSVINVFAAEMIAVPIGLLLQYIISMSESGASVNSARIEFRSISVEVLVATYALAGLFIVWWYRRAR